MYFKRAGLPKDLTLLSPLNEELGRVFGGTSRY